MSGKLTPAPIGVVRVGHWVSDVQARGGILLTWEHGDKLELVGTPDDIEAVLTAACAEVRSLRRELATITKGQHDADLPMSPTAPAPQADTPNAPPAPPYGHTSTGDPAPRSVPARWWQTAAGATWPSTPDAGRQS